LDPIGALLAVGPPLLQPAVDVRLDGVRQPVEALLERLSMLRGVELAEDVLLGGRPWQFHQVVEQDHRVNHFEPFFFFECQKIFFIQKMEGKSL
jgi:hypothetical protein